MLQKIPSDKFLKQTAKEYGITIKEAKEVVKFINKRVKDEVKKGNEITYKGIGILTFHKQLFKKLINIRKTWQK
jgi:nucleoid DNA-binding protein